MESRGVIESNGSGQDMDPITKIKQSELDRDPSARFWALIDYLVAHPNARSASDLRVFWHMWKYQAEVFNGGHLQYFHNVGVDHVQLIIETLDAMGAREFTSILRRCWEKAKQEPVRRVRSLEEYSELAGEGTFDNEDEAYYALSPELPDLMEEYYASHVADWVGVRA
ncbi:MAG: hypothetical protein CMJ49_10115 [Planctomycetaceae bacterium]|nr:hypothetical protein [Planctomycetaceae bacterium]